MEPEGPPQRTPQDPAGNGRILPRGHERVLPRAQPRRPGPRILRQASGMVLLRPPGRRGANAAHAGPALLHKPRAPGEARRARPGHSQGEPPPQDPFLLVCRRASGLRLPQLLGPRQARGVPGGHSPDRRQRHRPRRRGRLPGPPNHLPRLRHELDHPPRST